jgi:pimeloyl-ACP methyl ester carboxylesterase
MTFDSPTPVTVGGLTFDVRFTGPDDGPPVFLLHGFPETSLSWTQVAPQLAEAGLRVVAPDQRGYSPGARPTGVAAYATDLLVADVVGLADSLGIASFDVVGHDWGAVVAWLVAAAHPERVRSLTAVSVPHLRAYNDALRHDPDQRQKGAYLQVFRQEGRAEELLLADGARRLVAIYGDAVPTALAVRYVAHLAEPGALTAALGWYRAMTAELASAPRTVVPTTFVWGAHDQAIGRVPAEACGDFVDADYRFVELSDIGHWVPEQAPDALAAAVLDRVRT